MKVRTRLGGAALLGILCAAGPLHAAELDCAGKTTAHQITVQVTGLKPAQGEAVVTLYPDDARRFLTPRGKLARQRIKITSSSATACFSLAKPGIYAIAVYHDVNGDRDFNRNKVGVPTEGFGFSNDAPTRYGLPSFDSVRFTAKPGETTLTIRTRYQR